MHVCGGQLPSFSLLDLLGLLVYDMCIESSFNAVFYDKILLFAFNITQKV